MTNLENMVNEKDGKTQEIRISIADALQQEKKKYNKEINQLRKDYEKSLSKLKKTHDSYMDATSLKEVTFLNALEQQYIPMLAISLMKDLNRDNETMKQRAECTDLCKEKIDNVLKLKKSMSSMGDKKSIDFLLENLNPEIKALLNNPNIENFDSTKEIRTYISSNGIGCYILTPVIDESANKFTNELVNKLFGITKLRKIVLEGDKVLNFEGKEFDYANKFAMFQLGTPSPADLAKALINKLNDDNIQPKSFKEGNMTHRAVLLDYTILKNFMNYKESTKGESEIKVPGKRGPYQKKSKVNLESSVVSHESLGSKGNKKSGHSAISPEYVNPQTVIDAYNIINDKFREENGEDMVITKLLNLKIGGKGGGALYDSLVNHIKNRTIKPEYIHSRSNLEKYVNKAGLKLKEKSIGHAMNTIILENDTLDFNDFRNMEPHADVMNAKTGNCPIAVYEQFKLKYDALTEKYGHAPTRSEMGWNRRGFYKKIKEAEDKYEKFDFIPDLKSGKRSKKGEDKERE